MKKILVGCIGWALVVSMVGCLDFSVHSREFNGKHLDEGKQVVTDFRDRMEAGEYHGAVGLFSEQMFQHMQRSPVEIADSLLAHKRDRLGALKSFKFLSGEARSQRQLSGSTTQCLLHYEVVYEKLTVQESFRLSKRGGDPFQIEWYGIRCLHCSKGKANSMCSMKSMDGVRP